MKPERKDYVVAVALLGDEVFIVRLPDRHRIEVYDAVTFTLQRYIAGLDLPGPSKNGITACAKNNCIYLANIDMSSVHRVDLSGSRAVNKWPVARIPTGLSVNNAHNLVVACRGITFTAASKIQEYTTHGSLVREICPRVDIFHAVQLCSGDYVISQGMSPDEVCVVAEDGQVVSSYRQSAGGLQMRHVASLAVTKDDDILVADENNDRILSISGSTGDVQKLALPTHVGIRQPCGLCLDAPRGRLYVSQSKGALLVFDGVAPTM